MKNVYIQNEANNNFKDWTKQGLEFLLFITSEDRRMQYKIKKKLEKYKKIMTLEMLNMEETHTFNSKKTKKEIKKYNLEITQLLDKSYQAFKNKSLNNFPKPLIFSIK